MGASDVPRPPQVKNTIKPESENIRTVQVGQSTIHIRDDGNTIHYESDLPINMFDFMDFLNGNYGPNREMGETVKIKKTVKPDVVAEAQRKTAKPQQYFVTKDSVRPINPPTERQLLENQLLELYGEKGRRGTMERNSLDVPKEILDNGDITKQIIEVEKALEELDRQEKKGLYDDNMNIGDRLKNTVKQWGNEMMYGVEYVTQTAATALEDLMDRNFNEGYKAALEEQSRISIQMNRILLGLDSDPDGTRYAALKKQLEEIQGVIDEQYRIKMDTTTDAYRAMERADKYAQKAVEGLTPAKKAMYNIAAETGKIAVLNPLKSVHKWTPAILEMLNSSAEKMHEINTNNGTPGQALGQGISTAIMFGATEKMSLKELSSFADSGIGKIIIKEEFAKHGIKISENVLKYTIDYIIDSSFRNPEAELSLEGIVEEILVDYGKSLLDTY